MALCGQVRRCSQAPAEARAVRRVSRRRFGRGVLRARGIILRHSKGQVLRPPRGTLRRRGGQGLGRGFGRGATSDVPIQAPRVVAGRGPLFLARDDAVPQATPFAGRTVVARGRLAPAAFWPLFFDGRPRRRGRLDGDGASGDGASAGFSALRDATPDGRRTSGVKGRRAEGDRREARGLPQGRRRRKESQGGKGRRDGTCGAPGHFRFALFLFLDRESGRQGRARRRRHPRSTRRSKAGAVRRCKRGRFLRHLAPLDLARSLGASARRGVRVSRGGRQRGRRVRAGSGRRSTRCG
mmetsp:Transcript_13665/g.45575  ORF Transcript_13665/g.45575 Transcript_13665/m.45575 type:complete len:296 (-) Transcript_13665:1571-2458(-)